MEKHRPVQPLRRTWSLSILELRSNLTSSSSRPLREFQMTPPKTSTVPQSFSVLLLAFVLLATGACLVPYFLAPPGHDQNSYLFEAQRLLSGAELYGPHLSETNPPIIIWFSTIPVLLARWLHGSPVFFLRLFVATMVLGSVGWCVRILRRSAAPLNPLSLGLLAIATLAIELSIGPCDFAQREHLLIILLLPYILATATGAVDRISFTERCALGIAAGIAIWFKPQDALILVALELFLALRLRSLRRTLTPEFLALVFTSALILLLVSVLTPLYGRTTLPLLVDTYWGLGEMTTLALAHTLRDYIMAGFALLLLCLVLRKSLRDPATSVALLACSVAASFAYDIQHTAWPYHAYPHQALLLLALAYLLLDFLDPVFAKLIAKLNAHPRLFRRSALVVSALVALFFCAIAIRPHTVLSSPVSSSEEQPQWAALDQFFNQFSSPTTVYVFSTSVPPLSVAYNHGLTWGSRFAHLWMLPAIIQNEAGPTGPPVPFKQLSPERLAALAALQRTQSAEDLNDWKPSIVLVQQCSPWPYCQAIKNRNFDMLAWFLQDPGFAAAWSQYRQQPGIRSFNVYKRVR
jgi:hypothetical protein